MLFAGPFEDDIDWKLIATLRQAAGVHQWLGRVFAAVSEAVASVRRSEALVRLTTRRSRVSPRTSSGSGEHGISKLMVLTNEMRTTLDAGGGARSAAAALAQLLAPLAPFAAEELWRVELGNEASVHRSSWPTYDPALVVDRTVTLVVQVDGKVRDTLEVAADISEADALAAAIGSAGAQRALAGREIRTQIVRAPKLVNLLSAG